MTLSLMSYLSSRKFLIGCIAALITLLIIGIDIPSAFAATKLTNTFTIFEKEVNKLIQKLVNNSDSDIYVFVWMIYTVFFICSLIAAVIEYTLDAKLLRLVTCIINALLVSILLVNYSYLTTLLWSIGDNIGFSIQKGVVGNTDPMFLTNYITTFYDKVKVEEVGIFDAVSVWVNIAIFHLVGVIMDSILYIGSVWAVWGYALAKFIGMCFVPLLLLESTKSLFDSWVKLFLGFLFFNLILRVLLCIYAILVNIYANNGALSAFIAPMKSIVIKSDFQTGGEVLTLMLGGILAAASAAGFASILAGGFQGASGGLNAIKNAGGRAVLKSFSK